MQLSSTEIAIKDVLAFADKKAPKQVASFIGKIISLEPAFGQVVQLLTRNAQQKLLLHVQAHTARACLKTCQDSFGPLNGALTPNILTALPLSAM